jgi:hypothetical protein
MKVPASSNLHQRSGEFAWGVVEGDGGARDAHSPGGRSKILKWRMTVRPASHLSRRQILAGTLGDEAAERLAACGFRTGPHLVGPGAVNGAGQPCDYPSSPGVAAPYRSRTPTLCRSRFTARKLPSLLCRKDDPPRSGHPI